jgi:hypothetical protein
VRRESHRLSSGEAAARLTDAVIHSALMTLSDRRKGAPAGTAAAAMSVKVWIKSRSEPATCAIPVEPRSGVPPRVRRLAPH